MQQACRLPAWSKADAHLHRQGALYGDPLLDLEDTGMEGAAVHASPTGGAIPDILAHTFHPLAGDDETNRQIPQHRDASAVCDLPQASRSAPAVEYQVFSETTGVRQQVVYVLNTCSPATAAPQQAHAAWPGCCHTCCAQRPVLVGCSTAA